MQVLVKNPFGPKLNTLNLTPSFWTSECLYPNEAFSLGSLLSQTDPLGLSPLLSLDPRLAFLLFQMEKGKTKVQGLGALGTITAAMNAGMEISHDQEGPKFRAYCEEYLPENFIQTSSPFDQVVTFGPNELDFSLWEKLRPGGFYLMGSLKKITLVPGQVSFEAFGRLWPYGEATEFGWRFDEKALGLENFEFVKIKKS